MAWTTREKIKNLRVVAWATINEPPAKISIQLINRKRRPYTSEMRPSRGMATTWVIK
jgi:hypothetical protein